MVSRKKLCKYKSLINEARRGVRVVHGAALEKRSPRKRGVGSNPTLSADMVNCGEVLEWTIRRAWRARVA